MALRGLQPGSRAYTRAIVAAQMLAQIGAFALPALLPGYIARWDLSKTEAGWLVGIFFAAYVVMVPILVALTDRVPARRVYMLGTGLTALAHLGFALFADGFWSGLVFRILAGIGWAGTYMPGLKAIADPLEGVAQSRAVSWHAAGVGISGAAFLCDRRPDRPLSPVPKPPSWSAPQPRLRPCCGGDGDAGGVAAPDAGHGAAATARFPAGVPQSRGHGLDRRLYGPHLGTGGAARLGRDLSRRRHRERRRACLAARSRRSCSRSRALVGIAVSITGNETAQRWGRARVVTVAMSTAAALSLVAGWSAGISALFATLAGAAVERGDLFR